MIDWKKVARERQKKIRTYRIERTLLASDMEDIVYRCALNVLGARCVHGCAKLAREIAECVAGEIAEGPE